MARQLRAGKYLLNVICNTGWTIYDPQASRLVLSWLVSIESDTFGFLVFIHGGRTVVRVATKHQDQRNQWIHQLDKRRGKNIAAVAVANKNARIAWALLSNQTTFQAKAA